MENTMTKYKEYLQLKNYSTSTIELYLYDLSNFKNFLKEYDNLDIGKVTKTEVLQYLYYLNDNGNKSRTRHHKLNALKSFYKWYCKIYGGINPTYNIKPIKRAKTLPKHLSLEQALNLENIFTEAETKNYLKYNTIIKVFLNTGLRVSEVCNIKIKDVDMENRSINVECKGDKQRQVYFTNELKKCLKTYSHAYKPQIYLFESKPNKPYSRRNMYEIIQRAYKLLGIKGMTVHTLRHTVATILYEKTKDILVVKEFLGHQSIESTTIYTHVSNEAIREAVEKNPLNI